MKNIVMAAAVFSLISLAGCGLTKRQQPASLTATQASAYKRFMSLPPSSQAILAQQQDLTGITVYCTATNELAAWTVQSMLKRGASFAPSVQKADIKIVPSNEESFEFLAIRDGHGNFLFQQKWVGLEDEDQNAVTRLLDALGAQRKLQRMTAIH